MASGFSVKRTRRRHTAVRTGCYTCKIRRIKCDEARPTCARCTSTGRKCDGYPTGSTASKVKGTLQTHLSLQPFTDAGEGMSFDYFCRHTVSQLFGYVDTSSFWRHIILQMCYSEPVVRYAAMSLSDLHRSFADSLNPGGRSNNMMKRERSALVHYLSALSHMKFMVRSQIRSMDSVLMACLLLSSIEIFQGRHEAADIHLRCALQVSGMVGDTGLRLQRWHASDTTMMSNHPMLGTLVRLRFQCDMFLNVSSAIPHHLAHAAQHFSPTKQNQFTSLSEARDILFTHIDQFTRLVNRTVLTQIATTPGDIGDRRKYSAAMVASGEQLRQLQVEGLSDLLRWDGAYQAFLAQHAHAFSPYEQHAATVVELYRDILRIMLRLDHSKGELAPDPFEQDFGLLLSRIQMLISDPTEPAVTPDGQPVFTLEMGLVPLLYSIASDCRGHAIRHAALAILAASPRREGTWDGTAVYEVARRCVALEETSRLEGEMAACGIPQRNRILGLEAQIDLLTKKAAVILHQAEQSHHEVIQW
ncbi:hypothetical protein ETB97_012074 [Aspergillus alliaceus]|uniref:Zn(2)-C6 fungal-type domain-containing protein n=1 Tax=Petromyces alliaceus TaxID=209559 RepID=A0A8H6A5T3_PETAA|nr:hypothetical protein ETB97_012074 [Aspergillus burnettii]